MKFSCLLIGLSDVVMCYLCLQKALDMMYVVPKKANDMMNVGMLEGYTVRKTNTLVFKITLP